MMQRVLVLSAIGLGVLSGCASTEEDGDVAASQSQALCPIGGCEPPDDEPPPPPGFDCPIGQTFADGSWYQLNGDQCVHYVYKGHRGPGGSYYASTYNPCPYFAPHYTCTWYGSCQCY